MVFVPDLKTMTIDPFTEVPTVNMVGDVLVIGKDNLPFDQYPRSIAKRSKRLRFCLRNESGAR